MYKQIVAIRSAVLVFLTHKIALPLLKLSRKPAAFPYRREDLLRLSPQTLGYALVKMLDSKNLQLLTYYVKHDMKHILLEYDTTDEGEVCLQCFMLGNRHISLPVAATVLFGLLTMPEYWSSFYAAYQRGQKSIAIERWPWFSLTGFPTAYLQHKINSSVTNKKNTQ